MKISRRFLLPSIVILGLYFIVRIINQSGIIRTFPLDYTNDISSYMTMLHFLAEYGFLQTAPEWYNGYTILNFYSPGWFFFSLPLQLLVNNIQLVTFISMIVLFILGFIFFYLFGKTQKLSTTEWLFFSTIFFANPINIGNFIRLGRIPELFAWVFMIAFASLIFYYRNHILDKKFYMLFIPLYTIMILSHPQESILSSFLVLSLFLIKSFREKTFIVLSSITSVILSSFWLVPFFLKLRSSTFDEYVFTSRLLQLYSRELLLTNIMSFIIPIAMFVLFYFHYKSSKSKKELLFFSPILLLALLFITRAVAFIPVLDQVYPDPYIIFFLFFSLFFLLKTDFNVYPEALKALICIALIVIPLVSVYISHIYTPYFIPHSQIDKDVLGTLDNIDERYVILGLPAKLSYSRAIYSYGAIYKGLKTPEGWSNHEVSREYQLLLDNMYSSWKSHECDATINALNNLNTREVISYKEECNFFKECGLKEKSVIGDVCLYSF